MRDDYRAFQALGAQIVVVTRHDPDKAREYWSKHKLPFLGIADPEGNVTKRFGQQWRLLSLGRMPAQLVVDCQGKLALTHYGKSMSDILSNTRILSVIKELGPCPGK